MSLFSPWFSLYPLPKEFEKKNTQIFDLMVRISWNRSGRVNDPSESSISSSAGSILLHRVLLHILFALAKREINTFLCIQKR